MYRSEKKKEKEKEEKHRLLHGAQSYARAQKSLYRWLQAAKGSVQGALSKIVQKHKTFGDV